MASITDRIDQGEIIGSFCPGEFDLSIGGRKFCGIAQRRQQLAISVQAFLIVEGRGEEKAALARGFYETAQQFQQSKHGLSDCGAGKYVELSGMFAPPLTADNLCEQVTTVMGSQRDSSLAKLKKSPDIQLNPRLMT